MKRRRSKTARERLRLGGGRGNSKVHWGRGSWQRCNEGAEGVSCKETIGHCHCTTAANTPGNCDHLIS
jgi:hypothetical protein